jgi:phosphohistidine phosphatase
VQVFLIRHAEAVDETLAVRDPHRPLTAHGRDQARALGERLRWHDCAPTRIISSPLVRAVQTAELVAAALATTVPVDIEVELSPDGDPGELADALRRMASDDAVVVVGHEPSLSALGALVAGEPGFPALAKAEAVRIVDGHVRWRFGWDAEAPRPL